MPEKEGGEEEEIRLPEGRWDAGSYFALQVGPGRHVANGTCTHGFEGPIRDSIVKNFYRAPLQGWSRGIDVGGWGSGVLLASLSRLLQGAV